MYGGHSGAEYGTDGVARGREEGTEGGRSAAAKYPGFAPRYERRARYLSRESENHKEKYC